MRPVLFSYLCIFTMKKPIGDISEQIFHKIDEKNLQPIPRWHFLLGRGVFWSLLVFSVFVWTIATSVWIYVFFDHDPSWLLPMEQTPVEDILQSIPYIWMVVLLIFSVIAYYGLRQTKKWYRYTTVWVILWTLLVSFLWWLALNTIDFWEGVHRYLLEHTSLYDKLIHSDEDDWSQTNKWFLGGKIISLTRGTGLVLKDFKGNIWNVFIESSAMRWISIKLAPGDYIKIKWTQIDSDHFNATFIQLWD